MYAKVLNDGGPLPIPMLLITAPEGSIVVEQLRTRGWTPYAGRPIEDHGAEIRIMPDHLTVVLGGEVVLHDGKGDPVSPPGWWKAVSSFEDRALIVLLPHAFPMTQEDAGAALGSLIDSPETAQCFATVVHE